MVKLVVGLTGPIGSGKDTLALGLVEKLGAVRIKFADPLYKMATALDSAIHPDMAHADKDGPLWGMEGLPTRRRVMETLGTEWGRALHTSLWIDAAKQAIGQANTDLVVVSDVRFPDEAEYIRSVGVLVHLFPNWECQRTGHVSDARLEKHGQDVILPLSNGKVADGLKGLQQIIDLYRLGLVDSIGIP